MIKKLFLALAFVAVLGLGAVYFFGSSALNKGIQTGVETFGPRITQTPVTLESVDLSLLSGKGMLNQLKVGNPEGFNSDTIFALGQIDVDVDTGSVFSDTIILNQVHIRALEMSYEKTLRSSNVKELLANIESFTGPADPSTPAQRDKAGAKKQVVIKELIIEDAKVYVGAMGIGQTVKLPRIEMTDIGEGGDRVTLAQAIDLVLNKVIDQIGPAAANWMVDQKRAAPDDFFAIINVGSISATVASVNRGEYCVSKAGMAMMTALFAARLGEYAIPVYEVRPGVTKTDMTRGVTEKYDKLIQEGLCATPRWGYPEDVGKAVGALARGDFPYSTGQHIMVDGGLTLPRL